MRPGSGGCCSQGPRRQPSACQPQCAAQGPHASLPDPQLSKACGAQPPCPLLLPWSDPDLPRLARHPQSRHHTHTPRAPAFAYLPPPRPYTTQEEKPAAKADSSSEEESSEEEDSDEEMKEAGEPAWPALLACLPVFSLGACCRGASRACPACMGLAAKGATVLASFRASFFLLLRLPACRLHGSCARMAVSFV